LFELLELRRSGRAHLTMHSDSALAHVPRRYYWRHLMPGTHFIAGEDVGPVTTECAVVCL